MRQFIYNLRSETTVNKNMDNCLDVESIKSFGVLFEMDFQDFEFAYKRFKPTIKIDSEKEGTFDKIISQYELSAYRDLVALFLKKLEFDIPFLENKIAVDVNLTDDIVQNEKDVNSLIKLFDYYINYEKSYGEKDELLNGHLVFKPQKGKNISIKHGFIIHSIVASAFHSITGIKEIGKATSDDWKLDVKKQFKKANAIDIKIDYLSSFATKVNSFFIAKGLAKNTEKDGMQNKVAKFIVDILTLSGFDKIHSIPDYKGVKYWIKRARL